MCNGELDPITDNKFCIRTLLCPFGGGGLAKNIVGISLFMQFGCYHVTTPIGLPLYTGHHMHVIRSLQDSILNSLMWISMVLKGGKHVMYMLYRDLA